MSGPRPADSQELLRLDELLAELGKTAEEIDALYDEQLGKDPGVKRYIHASWVQAEIKKAERQIDGA